MKTLNLTNFAKLALGCLVVLAVACDKKSGSDPAPVAVTNYGYVSGSCRDLGTQAVVAQNLCANVLINNSYRYDGVTCRDVNNNVVSTNLCTSAIYQTTNSQYRWNGASCVDINNNVVAQNLCTQTTIGSGYQILGGNCIETFSGMSVPYSYCSGISGYNPNQCSGIFMKYLGYGMFSYKRCDGNSCSGQTLIEYTTGQTRTCP